MRAPLSRLPALPAAIGIAGGIVGSVFLPYWAVGAIAFAAFVALYLTRRHFAAFVSIFIAIGAVSAGLNQPVEPPEQALASSHEYAATILSSTETTGTYLCSVEITRIDSVAVAPFLCQLTIFTVAHHYEPGEKIVFTTKLKPLDTEPEIPHQADSQRYLRHQGIVCTAFVASDAIRTDGQTSMLQAMLSRLRNGIERSIVDSPIDPTTAGFLIATIVGDRYFLSPELTDDFRALGISHILALSGLHVGIIVMLISLALLPLRLLRRGFAVRSIIVITLVWLYAAVTGMAPSVVRAAVMVSVYLLANLIGRGHNGFNSLCLAAALILAVRPMWLFTPGFQLSFAAVWSILLFAPLIPSSLRRRPVVYFLANIVVIPIAAMLGTGLISAYYFGRFPLLFLISNLVAAIIVPWLISAGAVLAIATALGINFTLLGSITDLLYNIMVGSINIMSSVPHNHISVGDFSAWTFVPYFAGMVALYFAIMQRRALQWVVTAALFAATGAISMINIEKIPQTEAYLPHNSQYTDLIVAHKGNVWLYTTAQNPQTALDKANRRYQGFAESRGCKDGIKLASGNSLTISGKRYLIVASDSVAPAEGKTDYVIVCKGFTADISEIERALRPDTILLSPDLHPRRALRYNHDASLPCINLRNTPARLQ